LTFERAIIDAQASFAHGQVYVALSRCKTLDGMVLSRPINHHSIINDNTIKGFTEHIEQNQPGETQLNSARIAYQHELLMELFRYAQFRNRVLYIEKIINENKGSIPAPAQNLFRQMFPALHTEIWEVADKFQSQIKQLLHQQPDIEQNNALQIRIGKAAGYFSEKIKAIILDVLPKVDLDIDNKAVKKQLNDAVKRFENDARIKYETLMACLNGFCLKDLLQAKAIASIEKAKPKEAGKKETDKLVLDNEIIPHPVLFNQLRLWRTAKATELNVAAYAIFSQKTLYELVNYLPADKKSLLKINGIGEKKITQFGQEIIEIIREYCEEKGLVLSD
jgi:transcriptional regulator of met regulon